MAHTSVPKLEDEGQKQNSKSKAAKPTTLLPVIVSTPEPKVSSSELPSPEVMSIASTAPSLVKGRSVKDVGALLNMLVEVH